MNIYIKSFNRPLYLERCIKSIYLNVKNYKKIIILDDGTLPEYLEVLHNKYTELEIRISPGAKQKEQIIRSMISDFNQKKDMSTTKYPNISPADFWTSEIGRDSEDYCMILEDDIWFTQKLDLDLIEKNMEFNNTLNVKLIWLGNKKISGGEYKIEEVLLDDKLILQYVKPPLITKLEKSKAYNLYLKYCKRFILNKVEIYSIYQVAMAIYKKDYWLNSWKGIPKWNDERYQLKKAVDYIREAFLRGENPRFAKTEKEVLCHGFSTSVTLNGHALNKGLNCLVFNEFLNRKWLQGKINVMESYPKDFSEEYLINVLRDAGMVDEDISKWQQWKREVIKQYEDIGCENL